MFPDLNQPYTAHPWLDDAGTPLPEVTDDIDGNPRDSNYPDIGCCEFTSDPGATPYSGTLIIGSGGDFASFSDAVDSLVFRGISGPVILDVLPGNYDEQISIRSIPGTSWQDTVVFQSSTGNPEDVTLHHTPAGADDNYTIQIYGADHLCFESMILFSDTSAAAPRHRVVDFFGEAENIQFRDNRIFGPPYHTISSYDDLICIDDSYATRRLIMNNYFEGGNAVYASGGDQTGLVISGNVFARLRKPICLKHVYAPTLIGNVMTEVFPTGTDRKAIRLYQCDGPIRIEKNQMYVSGGSCFELSACNATVGEPGLIANNFFRAGGGTGEKYGFVFRESSYQDFYHNSINITGSSATTNGRCIYLRSTNSNLEIVNNILCNSCDGYTYYVELPAAITTCDYNDIYSTGPNLASWGGVDVLDLDSLRTVSGNDSNSVSADPGFISDFDLHVTSTSIDSMATPLPEVTGDIDDELRDPNFPDIGADEFIPGFNYPPVITSDPDTIAYADSLYQYQVMATDQNGDTLTYSLSVAPSWLTVDDSTGLIEGTPTQNNVGDTTVTVVVDDGNGGSDSQTYALHVLLPEGIESTESRVLRRYVLSQNYPNPFSTIILFGMFCRVSLM